MRSSLIFYVIACLAYSSQTGRKIVKFDKLYPFLDAFRPCTMHTIQEAYPEYKQFHNFDQLCKLNCVRLQTTKSFPKTFYQRDLKLTMKFGYENISLPNQRIFVLKHDTSCYVEIFFTTLMNDQEEILEMVELEMLDKEIPNQIPYRSTPPDFTVIPIAFKLKDQPQIYVKVPYLTRSKLVLLNITNSEALFLCLNRGKGERKFEIQFSGKSYLEVQPFVLHVKIKLDDVYNLTNVTLLLDNYIFQFTQKAVKADCPIKSERTHDETWKAENPNWNSCLNELLTSKVNTTLTGVDSTTTGFYDGFRSYPYEDIKHTQFCSSYGGENYAIKYSLFYNSAQHRKINALISPFSLQIWTAVLVSLFLAGLTIRLSSVKFDSMFWLITVIFEQNDDKRSKINRVNIGVVLIWLFVAHVLRNIYTSDLYSYMTLELPADLPKTLEEIASKTNITLLTTEGAIRELFKYKKKKSFKASNLVESVIQKHLHLNNWGFITGDMWMTILFDGEFHTCYLKGLNKVTNPEICEKLKKFAYLTLDGTIYSLEAAMKLRLVTAGIGLKIYDSSDPEWFQTGEIFASYTDNVFRSKLEKSLAQLVESGVASLQKSYMSTALMKHYVTEHFRSVIGKSENIANDGNSKLNLGFFAQLWMQNGCFLFYSKEKCDLNLEEDLEITVKLIDFLAVWILFGTLLIFSVFVLTCELIFKKQFGWL